MTAFHEPDLVHRSVLRTPLVVQPFHGLGAPYRDFVK